MNNSKKINVSYSSLVGLKAELLRKQAEVEEARSKNKRQSPTLLKSKLKTKTSKNSNSGLEQSSKTKASKETEIEDVNDLKKSRYMLEAKSKLYQRLKKNHGDKSHNYLVDFSNKPTSSPSSSSSSSSSDDEIYNEGDYEDRNSDPEDDWVEYSDCFGRSRKCLRRDLPEMQEKDKMIKQEISKEPPEVNELAPKPPLFIPPPTEPEIEKLRKKWEKQTEKLSHKPDIHYQDILFDEARAHGVGYYAFSQDEEERLKQQENLSKIRRETEQQQKEAQSIKELKVQMEKNRLKAARIRQRIRAGLPAEPEEEEEEAPESQTKPSESSESSKDPEKSPNIEDKNESNSLCIIEDKIKAFGELLGKRPKFRELSQEEWIHKRRKDRMGEFAPVYDKNFKSGGLLKGTRDNQVVRADDDDDDNDPVRIRAGGPEPTDLWESQGPGEIFTDKKISRKMKTRAKSVDQHKEIDHSEGNQELKDSNVIGPVPPPDLFNPEGSSLINIRNPPFNAGNSLSNSSVADPSLMIIPPIDVLRSVPPPTYQSTVNVFNARQTAVQLNHGSVVMRKDEEESGESDDSEIIGPLPPMDIKGDEILADIPLPENPPPPPSVVQTNMNVDKISEGLKFLRKKFDQCRES